jgi:hypothetical protein
MRTPMAKHAAPQQSSDDALCECSEFSMPHHPGWHDTAYSVPQ